MEKPVFEISKRDCPSEENLIRLKLDQNPSIAHLDCDIVNRKLTVFHSAEIDKIEKSVIALNLGGQKISTEQNDKIDFKENKNQKKLLSAVLAINFSFFIIEMSTDIISKSRGLISDSLVYGISLFVVGATLIKKADWKTCRIFSNNTCGYRFCRSLRRFFGEEKLPDFSTMIIVSIFTLIANGICLYISQKSIGKEEAYLKASMILLRMT